MLQEDLEVIKLQFKLVQDTIDQYSVYKDNVYNFNKTSFQIGVISSIKVVTGLERRTRPDLIQLGDQEQVTVIQSICSARYAILLFIIYKGRVYISAQYKEADILRNQKLSISKNSQTNNALSLKQLKHFNNYTKTRQRRSYRLLILDGYKSHVS